LAQAEPRGLVLVTGATGFVGSALVPALLEAGWRVRATGRDRTKCPARGLNGLEFVPAELSPGSDFQPLVDGAAAVVHLAARVHVMRERSRDPLAEFRQANATLTAGLAQAALAAGTRHFVFASSIKVNGEGRGNRPYSESDIPAPQDPYASSKLEAEQLLRECGLSSTILRPPLMYGPGVKGNFARLMSLVERGWPLPLASVQNRRSLLFVGNFCSAIVAALERPAPGARVYLLCDGEDVSVAELILRLGRALGRPARLFPFPLSALRAGAALAGLQAEFHRLADSLLIDGSRARSDLRWRPPYSLDHGLSLTAGARQLRTSTGAAL
jgi:nucleoside-diphosphate-sugar epimerase